MVRLASTLINSLVARGNVKMAGENKKRRRRRRRRRRARIIDDPENKKKTMKSRYLPEEISREILLRLPVKSVLRFRSVNKKLHQLMISTQQFVADHVLKWTSFSQLENGSLLLLDRCWCTFDLCCQRIYTDKQLYLAPPRRRGEEGDDYNKVRIVDYCDGVICLIRNCENRRTYDVMLWNPTIEISIVIPASRSNLYSYDSSTLFGFGCVDGECKLVVIPEKYMLAKGIPLKANVCSSKTRNWVTITSTDPSHQVDHLDWEVVDHHSVFKNGACHWIAGDIESGTYFVLKFNLREETFGKIAVPEYLGPTRYDHVTQSILYSAGIFVYDGSLCLVANMKRFRGPLVVWVMKEYGVVESWTRTAESIKLTGDVVGFTGGGEIAYRVYDRKKSLFRCNPVTGRKQPLSPIIDGVSIHSRLYAYRESLVLLNQEDRGELI